MIAQTEHRFFFCTHNATITSDKQKQVSPQRLPTELTGDEELKHRFLDPSEGVSSTDYASKEHYLAWPLPAKDLR
jgi:hypothetical protein